MKVYSNDVCNLFQNIPPAKVHLTKGTFNYDPCTGMEKIEVVICSARFGQIKRRYDERVNCISRIGKYKVFFCIQPLCFFSAFHITWYHEMQLNHGMLLCEHMKPTVPSFYHLRYTAHSKQKIFPRENVTGFLIPSNQYEGR